ncbi:MAG: ankyrin repeat domain-containing protein [Spirochaetales bacterium]|nr:ankyrin repeat domain-containing protein [Spirochaetales bacterium]
MDDMTDINRQDEYGWKNIHLAARIGKTRVITELLDKGADINARTADTQETALHLAATEGYAETVDLLLKKGAEIEAKDETGMTPLHKAALENRTECARFLIEAGAEIDAVEHENKTPLHFACEYGHRSMTDLLLKYKANPDALNERKFTPLYLASCFGYTDIMTLLLEKGAHLEAGAEGGPYPLTAAVSNAELEATKLLLKKGADPNYIEKDPDGGSYVQPMLHSAAANDNTEILKLLLENGANIKKLNEFDESALDITILHERFENTKCLVKQGADAEYSQISPLIVSIILDIPDDFKRYLKETRYVSLADKFDDSPLHWAVISGNTGFADALLKAGAPLTGACFSGYEPLHLAVKKNKREMVSRLIRAGADVNRKMPDQVIDGKANTPLHLACHHADCELVRLLLENGADVSAENAEGLTPVWTAVLKENPGAVKLLAEKGANMHVIDKRSNTTLLHAACWRNSLEIVRFLLEKGLDANAKDVDGNTSAWYAEEFGELAAKVIALLEKYGGK